MNNGKIVLEKTTDSTKIEAATTIETMLYLLAALITDVCETTKVTTPYFLCELAKSCKAMEEAKEMSENGV